MESSDLNPINVALVGDSVLDDHYWLDRPADDVRAQTERTLMLAHPDRSVLVHNLAVDESTISCVLRGRAPAGMLRWHTRDKRNSGLNPLYCCTYIRYLRFASFPTVILLYFCRCYTACSRVVPISAPSCFSIYFLCMHRSCAACERVLTLVY